MTLKTDILDLRSQGRTYDQISEELGCSKGTISYHLGSGQKNKQLDRNKRFRATRVFGSHLMNFRASDPRRNIETFDDATVESSYDKRLRDKANDFQKGSQVSDKFTYSEVVSKIGEAPVCYLSGRPIDLTNPRSFHFDHVVPRTKGGKNSLDNLGITAREANIAKSNLSVEELLELCTDILTHNGYTVTKGE